MIGSPQDLADALREIICAVDSLVGDPWDRYRENYRNLGHAIERARPMVAPPPVPTTPLVIIVDPTVEMRWE